MRDEFKDLMPITNLHRFFNIPDGEIEDYTLIDENGNDYDLQFTYIGGKLVRQDIYKHDGYFTSEEGLKLFENPTSFPQTRKAETKEDFEFIFNREKNIKNAKDESIFKEWLIEYFTSYLLNPLKENALDSQYSIIEVSQRFLKWLNSNNETKEEKATYTKLEDAV